MVAGGQPHSDSTACPVHGDHIERSKGGTPPGVCIWGGGAWCKARGEMQTLVTSRRWQSSVYQSIALSSQQQDKQWEIQL
jgi:flagellar hook-length control protein FliK